jgi:hypothetical protein
MSISWATLPKRKIIIFIVVLEVFAALIFGGHFYNQLFGPKNTIAPTISPRNVSITLMGKGELVPLHDAMAGDAELNALVERFKIVPVSRLLAYPGETNMQVLNILFRWAGVDQVLPGTYGPYIDARVVAFLKKLGAVPSTVLPETPLEMGEAENISQLWFPIFDHFRIRLVVQGMGKDVYGGKASYQYNKDMIAVDAPISPDFITAFQAELARSQNSGEAMRSLLDFVAATKGFEALSDQEQDMIMSLNAPAPAVEQPVDQPSLSVQPQSGVQSGLSITP